MKTFIYIVSLLILVLLSCKKEYTTTVIGTVINSGSRQPIDSVLVVLQDGIAGDGFLGDGKTTGNGSTTSTYTDASGRFKITLEGESPFFYAKKSRYNFVNPRDGSHEITGLGKGGNYDFTVEMDAEAHFNPNIKGINSVFSDSVFIDSGVTIPSMYILSNMVVLFGNGPHKFCNKCEGLFAKGDHFYSYWMKYQIKGIWKQKIDSVYIKSFTTFTDTIYY
jgi:hypothetical protein